MEIILAEGDRLASQIIKLLTNYKKTHVALRYSKEESNWLVHSSVGGVQPEWWFYFKATYPKMSRYSCNFSVGDQALDMLIHRIAHAEYDYEGLFGHALKIMLGLKKNPFGNKKKYKCTELIAEWFKECNKLDPSLGLKEFDPETVSPEDLEKYCLARADLFTQLVD